jgi:hypothetical protein
LGRQQQLLWQQKNFGHPRCALLLAEAARQAEDCLPRWENCRCAGSHRHLRQLPPLLLLLPPLRLPWCAVRAVNALKRLLPGAVMLAPSL